MLRKISIAILEGKGKAFALETHSFGNIYFVIQIFKHAIFTLERAKYQRRKFIVQVQTLSEKNLVSPISTNSQGEYKRREAVWDLFQSECAFLFDHLMVLKNVFLEPLKRIQVEGYAMFAEPQLLFGNLDELCSVSLKHSI